MNDNVDISMAVSTDKGLITPIIFGAATKTLLEVSADAKRLALKARDNKLAPAEVRSRSRPASACEREESGPGGLTREVDKPLAPNSPHDHMILRVERVVGVWVCAFQFQGGTFSISNLGMFPVDHFCAIINPPQAAIMAVGRGVAKVKLVHGEPTTSMSMVVTVSADSRVYVGDVGAKFLNSFKAAMENPAAMLMK
jgi:pyruvate dehydrogenase E2 component (dihydrolipoamide acetyltransferase)